ncbi:MAG: CDP-diacylglycerol--glycerol-3-phosphate 3-phosphatidyltransferase [Nitrospirae bacterium]|nr:CDP-diacylglycerol--glycerol-3-phosphate 3-phosphatidyltransferase [Nitrospirota bacterium]
MSTLRFNLPTILTLSRIIVIPLFILITPFHPFWGALVFAIASLTDLFDGYFARRSGQITKFGIILDPIADKFLVISALILLVDMGKVSVWIAIIIIVREFLITGLRVVALSKDIVIKAEMGGKLKTTAQFTAIIFLILGRSIPPQAIFGIDLFDIGTVLIWVAVLLSIVSGIQYSVNFSRKLLNMPEHD